MFLAKMNSSSSFAVALYQGSETTIGILLNLFGGAFADKSVDKRKILIITDFLCGLACLFLWKMLDSTYVVYFMIGINIIIEILRSFNALSMKAIIKHAIAKERITKFNSILTGLNEIFRIIDPIVSILIISFFSVSSAILFNGITFMVSAISEFMLNKFKETGGKIYVLRSKRKRK